MKNILLIEDDKFLSSLLKNRLEKEGLSVTHAGDGEEALNILHQTKPDLALLDIILPKKNGFEVLEEIQNNPLIKDMPVMIISNLGQDADVIRGKDLGAIEYYVKAETSIDDLVMKVKNYVGF